MGGRHRYFAIIAAMRTGSNLLERNLNQFPDLVCHGELYNPAFIGSEGRQEMFGIHRAARERDPDALIVRVLAEAGDRIPGFRIFDGHDPRMLRRVATDPDCARILLSRPPVESYVSLLIARETGQWLLGQQGRRRAAQVHFDPAAFEAYRARIESFRIETARLMQEAGLTAFALDYAAVKDLAVVNGLAAHIGSRHRLAALEERLVRQNPGPIEAKVENPEALRPYLAGAAIPAGEPERRGVRVRGFVACRTQPLLFAPMPGGPHAAVLRWMASLEGAEISAEAALANGPLLTGLSRREIDLMFVEGRLRTVFTVTRHPLARAYEVFMERIFAPGPDGFLRIREALIAHHGVRLPALEAALSGDRAALKAAGHGLVQHRAAFAAFLSFLKRNLAGQTGIRTDPLWAPQAELLGALAATYPLRLVMSEEWMPKGAGLLRALHGIEEGRNALLREPGPEPVFPLGEIVTEEIAALARAAYPQDHARLGYGAWRPPA